MLFRSLQVETIDIHCGGIDLQFPHHENEVAQSVCAHGGKPFARWWLHNGMLNMDGRKMSKSLGNVFRIDDVLANHPAEALRLALMSAHYRQPLDWTEGLIEQCVRTLDRLYGTLRDLAAVDAQAGAIPDAVENALLDDLNTPQALAALSQIAADARRADHEAGRARLKAELLSGGLALGLLQQDPAAWFARGTAGSELDAAAIDARVQERHAAKQARDFARADAIRKELAEKGIEVEDTPAGPRWKVAAK